MKRALRDSIIFIISVPTVVLVYILALFRGKKNAIALIGPRITNAAKSSLRYWVPDILDSSQFDLFRKALRNNIRRWKFLFDMTVVEDTPDTFKINVANCPFCEVFAFVGLREMNHYFCQGDWEKAKDNKEKWTFERTHTIAAGADFCDHTYRRIALDKQWQVG